MIEHMRIILLLIVILIPSSAFAMIDSEFDESRKCSNMFAYFEQQHNLPKNTLHAISLQETAKRHSQHKVNLVWPWTVNVEGQGYHFRSKMEAIHFVRNQLSKGKESIDVGCMQINLKYHPKAFRSLEEAFTPRFNVAYGAKFLAEKYQQLGSWDRAIGGYHSGNHDLASIYQHSVKKIHASITHYKDKLNSYAYGRTVSSETRPMQNYRYQQPFKYGQSQNKKVQVHVGRMNSHDMFRKHKTPIRKTDS